MHYQSAAASITTPIVAPTATLLMDPAPAIVNPTHAAKDTAPNEVPTATTAKVPPFVP